MVRIIAATLSPFPATLSPFPVCLQYGALPSSAHGQKISRSSFVPQNRNDARHSCNDGNPTRNERAGPQHAASPCACAVAALVPGGRVGAGTVGGVPAARTAALAVPSALVIAAAHASD